MSYDRSNQRPRTALVAAPTQPITADNAHHALTNIQEFFPPDKFNVIKPVQQLIPATLKGMKPDIKRLDLKDHTYNQAGKRALTKSGILMLADAYEVHIKLQSQPIIKPGQYCEFSFVASMMRNGVALLQAPGTQMVDMETEAELLRMDYEDKAIESRKANANWMAQHGHPIPNYTDGDIVEWNKYENIWRNKGNWERFAKREILRAKKNMVRMCESKAMLAAMRNILGVQATYSKEEVEKPFIVFRLEPDYSQMTPEQILGLREQARHASTLLAGQPIATPEAAMDFAPRNVATGEVDYQHDETADADFADEDEDYIDAQYDEVPHETPQEAQPVEGIPPVEGPAVQRPPSHSDPSTVIPEVLPPPQQASDISMGGVSAGVPPNSHVPAANVAPETQGGSNSETHQVHSGTAYRPTPASPPVGDSTVRPGGNQAPAEQPPSCPGCGAPLSAGVIRYCQGRGINPPACMKCQPRA